MRYCQLNPANPRRQILAPLKCKVFFATDLSGARILPRGTAERNLLALDGLFSPQSSLPEAGRSPFVPSLGKHKSSIASEMCAFKLNLTFLATSSARHSPSELSAKTGISVRTLPTPRTLLSGPWCFWPCVEAQLCLSPAANGTAKRNSSEQKTSLCFILQLFLSLLWKASHVCGWLNHLMGFWGFPRDEEFTEGYSPSEQRNPAAIPNTWGHCTENPIHCCQATGVSHTAGVLPAYLFI